MKNLILLTLFIFLSNCGYVPIYKDLQNANIKIFVQNSEGEENINNLLISKLKPYSTKEAEKNYVIDINSVYTKKVISKDSAGNAVDIELNLKFKFTVYYNEKSQQFSLTEKFNIKNTSDVFEMNNYEKILISIMPIIPHFSNECLNIINKNYKLSWPSYDDSLLVENTTNIVIQINGKKRGLINANLDIEEEELLKLINQENNLVKYFVNKKIKKKIFIKNKLINIII